MITNKYLVIFLNNYVKPFNNYLKDNRVTVRINGLENFIAKDNCDVYPFLEALKTLGFDISLTSGHDDVEQIQVEYSDSETNKLESFDYCIDNLISIYNLESLTDISLVAIMVMQIVSRIICRYKLLYKAIILDLDETVWKGTLAEDGFEKIKENLNSPEALPFISLMKFIKVLSQESGIYVAICSRNSPSAVRSAIDALSEKEFPIKNQIDCIIADDNDKSIGINKIANSLSILTSSCVFIDDNHIVRDEVRKNIPDVFVPDWSSHDELLTIIESSCIFDRFELSIKSRQRKHSRIMLQQERLKNSLPELFIICHEDDNHSEAHRLYTKSNQFKFSNTNSFGSEQNSLFLEITRSNGDSLGICSALTFEKTDSHLYVLNWAISCRFFEIGLEEYILLHLVELANGLSISFDFNQTDLNLKAQSLLDKYSDVFVKDKNNILSFVTEAKVLEKLQANTNLRDGKRG